jgi:vitamin B12 transporter
MSVSRLSRLAESCRTRPASHVFHRSIVLLLSTVSIVVAGATRAGAADAVSGIVVDQSGRPVPRALVRTLDRSGAETASVFADESGHFRIAMPATGAGDCRLAVSLTGFRPSDAPCAAAQPARVVLNVAPIEETVVVTATRTEAPAGQVGSSMTVFTSDDIERRQTPMVGDLLRTSPGAMVVGTGGPGGVTSLFVRGGESSYNKVLLDGIPLNEPGGTFNFSNVTSEGLERVEIVRGAQSALFGSDAMSSVVQMFTRRGDHRDGRPQMSASLEGGTYGTARGDGQVSGASGRFDYALGVGSATTDNRVPNNVFTNTTLFGNVGISLSDTATLRVVSRGELERTGTPGATAFGPPDRDAFFKRHDVVAGVSFDQQVSPTFRQRAVYSLSVSDQQSTNLVPEPPYTPAYQGRTAPFQFFDFLYDSLTTLHRHHASYQADWRLTNDASHGNQLLTFLADWDGERADLQDRVAATLTSPARDNFGWSVEHQALWRRTFVTVGGRVEHNDSFGTAAVPRGSIAIVLHPGSGSFGETTVHANAGLGIKEPTLLQSFSPSPYFQGNPNLQPEHSRTVEAGLEQRLANDRAKIDVVWFDNRYRNLIGLQTTNPATFAASYFNIGLTSARGLEAGLDVAPTRGLRARAGYTFLDSAVIDSTSPTNVVLKSGQTLFRRPRHSGYAGLSWQDARLTVDLNGVFLGSYVDSDFASLEPPLVSNPGYSTWDARLSFRLLSQLSATAAIDNLANAAYMEPLGYPGLGRAIRVGLRVRTR